MTTTSTTPETSPAAGEQRTFSTEVQQLLHLMVHSLYSKKEIFLRELISNSSDAIDTLRFLALTRPELKPAVEGEAAEAPAIELVVDKDQKQIRITDTGIGMTRQQVIDNIGTIARSGTATLVKQLAQQKEKAASGQALDVIGQFGVGFYSAFMVADKVELETLSAEPGAEAVLWSCEGGGTYTLTSSARRRVGTTVTLHMNADSAEFLEDWRLESIVKQYSNYVKWPIKIGERQLNRATALWAKRPSEVSEDEYKDFYKELMGGFVDGEPLARLHIHLDAPYQFQAIVYIPQKPGFDFMLDRDDKRRGMQLYVRRVFILDHADELLPPWLRFVRGVVDSDDLPLNVSREILQKNQVISTIQKQLVKKILEELKRAKNEKPELYREFFDEFGVILKEGVFLDAGNREKVAEVCLWQSLNTAADKRLSLPEYVAAMPEGQDEIYYITGASRAVLEVSPHVESLRRLGVDVLLLTDAVDEWVVQGLTEFDKKKLKPVHKGDFAPPKIKGKDGSDAAEKDGSSTTSDGAGDQAELGSLVAHLRTRFQEQLKEVRLSNRLEGSPCVLVSDEGDIGPHMEQILLRAGRKVQVQKPILEINPKNSLVKALGHLLATRPGSDDVATYSDLILDLAYLAQGAVPRPGSTLSALGRVLERDLRTVAGSAS
ncbi:MAG TPA: molecular chaperone HtpG [Pseudomonadota bacterium]|nr:molecular chaperone HtpG [Pseudomonadota bacterium]